MSFILHGHALQFRFVMRGIKLTSDMIDVGYTFRRPERGTVEVLGVPEGRD
jgi:hypothetical protein